jgi:hypothetical protein
MMDDVGWLLKSMIFVLGIEKEVKPLWFHLFNIIE